MIKIKRVYDQPFQDDGKRILIDRLWPRGLKKEDARIDEWLKEIAPSNELRKWFSHDPDKWGEFKKRFFKELLGKQDMVEAIMSAGIPMPRLSFSCTVFQLRRTCTEI